MGYFGVGLVIVLTVYAWGGALAALTLPRRWRRHWFALAPMAGLALITAAVWVGAYAGWPGTRSWAVWSWAVPLVLTAVLAWRLGFRGLLGLFAAARRHGAVAAVMVGVLAWTTWPLGQGTDQLTTVSLGSCDPADYAAGARVLLEFSRHEREGFLGLTEVVSVHSVDNFPDYWLRLNHLAPAAVVAWLSGAYGFKVHELLSVGAAAFLALGVPAVFWSARALFRLGPIGATLIAAAFGLGAANLYAVAHGALAQMIAAPAVAWLTWAGTAIWRHGASWRGALAWTPVLALGVWTILIDYNFMIFFAPAPLVLWVLARAVWTDDVGRFLRTGAAGLGTLAVVGLVAWPRVAGLRERFQLFEQYDFGWPVPGFTPERWFGWFGDTSLGAVPGWTPWLIGGTFVTAWVAFLLAASWCDRRRLGLVLACALTIGPGYGWLLGQAGRLGSNDSYDAYKVFATMHALILPALAVWLAAERSRRRWLRRGALTLGATLVLVHAAGALPLWRALREPPLAVDRALRAVGSLERRPEVTSLNNLLEPFWDRIWANALLLRKPQYFAIHTYEGRRPTPLRGQWDLRDGWVQVRPADGTGFIALPDRRHAVQREHPAFVSAKLGPGWFRPEAGGGERWVWASEPAAGWEIENPHPHAVLATVRGRGRSLDERTVALRLGEQPLGAFAVGLETTVWEVSGVRIPPGQHRLWMDSPAEGVSPGVGDNRRLRFAIYDLDLIVTAER